MSFLIWKNYDFLMKMFDRNLFIFFRSFGVRKISFSFVRNLICLYYDLKCQQCWHNVPDGVDGDLGVDVSVDLADIHVWGVLEVSGESVVLADEGIEDISEVNVGVLISGVDTAMLRNNNSCIISPTPYLWWILKTWYFVDNNYRNRKIRKKPLLSPTHSVII